MEELKSNREELLRWFQADVGEPAPDVIKEREPGESKASMQAGQIVICKTCKAEVDEAQMKMLMRDMGMLKILACEVPNCPYGSTRSR